MLPFVYVKRTGEEKQLWSHILDEYDKLQSRFYTTLRIKVPDTPSCEIDFNKELQKWQKTVEGQVETRNLKLLRNIRCVPFQSPNLTTLPLPRDILTLIGDYLAFEMTSIVYTVRGDQKIILNHSLIKTLQDFKGVDKFTLPLIGETFLPLRAAYRHLTLKIEKGPTHNLELLIDMYTIAPHSYSLFHNDPKLTLPQIMVSPIYANTQIMCSYHLTAYIVIYLTQNITQITFNHENKNLEYVHTIPINECYCKDNVAIIDMKGYAFTDIILSVTPTQPFSYQILWHNPLQMINNMVGFTYAN